VVLYAWSRTKQQFEPIGSFATGPNPVRIASQDLAGNGLGDLVVGNDLDHSLTIALQQSPGHFDTFTRSVGAGPSSITFADRNTNGPPDIVVSDEVSGDVSVLFNDATPTSAPTFTTQERYRAGPGLFDTNAEPNGTIFSRLQTVGVAADNFTGSGGTDVVALNANTDSFSLLRGLGAGSLADPQNADVHRVPAGAVQVLAGDFLHHNRQDVAILTTTADGTSQIRVYPGNGDGTFAAPLVSDANQGATGFTFLPGSGGTPDRFLVGNAYGDFLTLTAVLDAAGKETGRFAVDHTALGGKELAVGHTTDGRTFAVVADQNHDKVQLFYLLPGTDQFGAPLPLDQLTQQMLAPGAVQLLDLARDGHLDLVVADQLGNDVLVYPVQADGTPDTQNVTRVAVGFEPVAFTARDLNGDGVLDLAVVNKGSNDVSLLNGALAPEPNDPTRQLWTATTGPRLDSGGNEPIAIQAGDFTGNGIPDLRVTNAGGQVALLPGIGSPVNPQGTGFFAPPSPQTTANLGATIAQAAFDPSTGQEFVVRGDGGLDILTGTTFTPLPEVGVSTLAVTAGLLVAGFGDGSVGLLTESGALLAEAGTGFEDQPTALQALQQGNSLEAFLIFPGTDTPALVSFPIALAEVPHGPAVSEATTLPQSDLILVSLLTVGGLVERPEAGNAGAAPAAEALGLFLPPLQARAAAADNGNAAGDEAPPVDLWHGEIEPKPADIRWQSFQLGLDERWQEQKRRQQAADSLTDMLDTFKGVLFQIRDLFPPPAAFPDLGRPQVDPPAILPPANPPPGEAPEVPQQEGPAAAPAPAGADDGAESEADVWAVHTW
jgi:hypothetical protein